MGTKKSQIDIEQALINLQNKLYDISRRNPFVDVKTEKLWFQTESNIDQTKVKKIFTKQNFFLKEYGLETTLNIGLFLKWKMPAKDYFYCSPLLYQASRIKKSQKIELQYNVEIDNSNDWIVNPVVAHLFKQNFAYIFKYKYESINQVIDELSDHFNTKDDYINVIDNFDDRQEWQLIRQQALGTFNYHKSVLAKDFDGIINSPNTSVKRILGFENATIFPNDEGELDWFPLDISQKEVVSFASSNNLVIQGPPGTGKSHTIVTLLQHYLSSDKKVLFVSEKKSALDVVYKRMGELKPSVAYFDAEKQAKLSFYKSLKKTYEKSQLKGGVNITVEKNDLALSKSKIYPDKARVKEFNNSSISDLENELLSNAALEKEPDIQTAIPKYKVWNEHLNELNYFENLIQQEWQINTIGESLIMNLNKTVFNESEPIVKIDKKIDELMVKVNLIKHIQSDYQLDLNWNEFTKTCLSASILNMVNRSQIDLLFKETKAFKSFNNWSKKYQLAKHQLDTIRQKNLSWKKRPSIQDIEGYQFLVNSKGLLSKFKLRKLHQRLFKNYGQDVPLLSGTEILNRLSIEFELSAKIEEIRIKLKHNLNVLNPDTDIDFILNLRKKAETLSHNYYQSILEHEEQEELIGLLADQHLIINNINRIKTYLFANKIPQKIDHFLSYLSDLKVELSIVRPFVPEIKTILNLPLSILNFVKNNHFEVDELSRIVIKNELQNRLRYHDYLKHITGRHLLKDLTEFNIIKRKTFSRLLSAIGQMQINKWQDYETLSATPNSKLNTDDRAKKARFKKSKRLLLHEMNKKRQFLPVKDLFASCKEELTTLQPIWMLNPLAIAECLPLESEIFDVVIFDESSQIPFEDALPAIYRSKQVIVVGDSQQMPPGHFFSHSQNTTTLLDEAEKMLPNRPLLWHYRSEHPSLISFSNHHFYENELKLFPAVTDYNPIAYHYIANGLFSKSINDFEAMAVAQRYKELLELSINDIGIIAFSKEQEICIRKKIGGLNLPIPDSVEIRNLESVQGIEKAHVLISIGYAKNEDGRLNLNFGPINQEQGANRLNVLFSRATKKMEIYSSIKSSDLGLSDNRGLNLLSQFLNPTNSIRLNHQPLFHDILSEKIAKFLTDEKVSFNYNSEYFGFIINSFVNHKSQKVLLVNPGLYSEGDLDIGSIISLLKNRFKGLKIVLNNDWLVDTIKIKNEIKAFFES